MPRVKDFRTNFTAGELDPELLGRRDLKNYFNAAEKLRNVLVKPQGGCERRPGSIYKDRIPGSGNLAYRFESSVQGWTDNGNVTLSVADGVLTHEATANDPVMSSPSGLALDGDVYTRVVVRMQRTGGDSVNDFRLVWDIGSGIDTDSFMSASNIEVADGLVNVEFVVADATLGGHAWAGETIDSFDLHLGADDADDDDFEIMQIIVDTGTASNTRLIPFEFSTDEHYLFCLYDGGARIYKAGVEVADIDLPYASSELRASYDSQQNLVSSGVGHTQSYDTLVLFHESYHPRRIVRAGSDSLWTVDNYPYINIPLHDFGDDYTVRYSGLTAACPNFTGVNVSNLVDGSAFTTASADNIGDLSAATLAERLAFTIDLGSEKPIGYVDVQDLQATVTASGSFGFAYSNDGETWTVIGGSFDLTTSDVDYNDFLGVSARYLGIWLEAVDWGATNDLDIDDVRIYPGRLPVDEVQTVTYTTGQWTTAETFSFTYDGEETEEIPYQGDASGDFDDLAPLVEAALLELDNVSPQGISVTHSGTAELSIIFQNDMGGQPQPSLTWTNKSGDGNEAIAIERETKGRKGSEISWSATRGWPRCGTFFQGRLIVAGSTSRPSTVWGSRAGDIFDFNNRITTDDYAFEATADTDKVASFFAVNAGRHLQFFSSSAEFYVPPSDIEPITPTNFALRRSTQRGALAGLPVFDVDGAAIFVQRLGKTLREFIFTDTEAAYQANNISLLSSHLLNVPAAAGYRKAITTDDADYLHFANQDGTLCSYCTLRLQEVNAFTLQETDGLYHDIAVDLLETYQIVERTIDSETVRLLEMWDSRMRFDCGAADFDVTTPITTITGLDFLEGETVGFVIDGVLQTTTGTVASGSVTMPAEASSSWQLGLNFPDVSDDALGWQYWIRTLPPEVPLQDGTMFDRQRRVTEAHLLLRETTGVKLQDERQAMDAMGNTVTDLGNSPLTGMLRSRGLSGWDFSGSLDISDDRAGHINLLAVSTKVAV